MLHKLICALFSCRHPNDKRSWPITLKDRTYRVCTECGHEFPFDVDVFRMLTRREIQQSKRESR
jgi:hypothetical protein